MDKTTYTILKAIPENDPISLVDLLNSLLSSVNSLQVKEAVPYLESQKWLKVDHIGSTNPNIEITYRGLLALREAEEAERRYHENLSLVQNANTIAQDANVISAQANDYAKEANDLSREANRYSRKSNRISFCSFLLALCSALFTLMGNWQGIKSFAESIWRSLLQLLS